MEIEETEPTKEETSKCIVIHIKPKNIARFVSSALGVAIRMFTMLKEALDDDDRNVLENEQAEADTIPMCSAHVLENEQADPDTIPMCPAIPVLDIPESEDDDGNIEEQAASKEDADEKTDFVNWKEVETAIQNEVESIDWDKVQDSIKKEVESVDWDEVGNRIEQWSRSVDWDKVEKSISEAFEQIM